MGEWTVTYKCRECDNEWEVDVVTARDDDPRPDDSAPAGSDQCRCGETGEFWSAHRLGVTHAAP